MITIRRNRLFAVGVTALCLWLSTGHAIAGDDLTIITEDYPPLNYVEKKELKGPSVDIVRAITDRLGAGSKIKVYPWARGYKLLETRKNTVLFSTARTNAREKLFKWVGPVAEKKIGLFARRDRKIKLKTLIDAEKYLIGVQRGSVTMQYLEERGFRNFDPSAKSVANLRKLMGGRNDLWFASNSTVAGTCERLDVDVKDLELVLEIENTHIYIAFNKETPDDVIDRWQKAYDDLVNEGVVKKIFQNYNLGGMRPSVVGD